MTPLEAMKLLQKDLDDPGSVDILDLNMAQRLGIEALKRHIEDNKGGFGFIPRPLPGETEE